MYTPTARRRSLALLVSFLAATSLFLAACQRAEPESASAPRHNVIFIHPDGTGLGHWNAARHLLHGPDGFLHWDQLDCLAAYRPHQEDWLSTSSHAGATVHAYGRKVPRDSYGLAHGQPIIAANGRPETLMETAQAAGFRVGLVNSGHLGEPGTGVFLARSPERGDIAGITLQILESGADLIFGGGEVFLLPEGVVGFHGQPGRRTDGRHLIDEARANGYTVVFDRAGLEGLPAETSRVLGLFAAVDTYNDQAEEILRARGLPPYAPDAPRFDEMVATALRILGHDPAHPFFLVAEEEGTDNFSNQTNAAGMLEALRRADLAIGEARRFLDARPEPDTLLLVAADSDAGHPAIWAPHRLSPEAPLKPATETGATLDGREGTGTPPFLTPPDRNGRTHAFGIAWPLSNDMPGSAVARAHGAGAEHLGSTLDNSGVYPLLHRALFGYPPTPTGAP